MSPNALFLSVIFVLAAVGWLIYQHLQRGPRLLRQIREGWGFPKPSPCPRSEIALYHALLSRQAATSHDMESELDERTWDDLDMDAIFGQVDHAQSTVGKQFLYRLMRTPCSTADPLAVRDRQASYFAANESLRELLQFTLHALNSRDAASLPHLFLHELPQRPRSFFVFPLLTISALGCLAGAITHPMLLFGLAPIALANILIAPAYRRRIALYISPLRVLSTLLNTARRMQNFADAEASQVLQECLAPYRTVLPSLHWLTRLTPLLLFEQTSSSDALQLLYAYLNMLLLTDVNVFVFCLETIRRNQAAIQNVYEAVGTVDAMISVAGFRQALPIYTRPIFSPPAKTLIVEDMVHPLLANPVPNSFCLQSCGAFVTGSNMSGKTTFIRTVAVNAILAQTLDTCLATRWEAPFMRVRTCIGRGDSLTEGRSYYMAEVEAIGHFLEDAAAGPSHLFVIDEIYRGTNTTEGVAAAKAVLDALNCGPHFVFVSTHDTELSNLLKTEWTRFHFREFVEQSKLVFDYRLRPGLSSTRNALRLLAESGYPASVIQDAEATARQISQ